MGRRKQSNERQRVYREPVERSATATQTWRNTPPFQLRKDPLTEVVETSTNNYKKHVARAFHIGSLVSLPLHFAMSVIGLTYFGSCPAENNLPIYLLVSGLFSMIFTFLRLCGSCCRDDEDKMPYSVSSILGCMAVFLLSWYVAGTVWVFRLYNNYSTDINDYNYCNVVLYLFSFWLTVVTCGLVGIFLFISGIYGSVLLIIKIVIYAAEEGPRVQVQA